VAAFVRAAAEEQQCAVRLAFGKRDWKIHASRRGLRVPAEYPRSGGVSVAIGAKYQLCRVRWMQSGCRAVTICRACGREVAP
jgi:hypothetical protein